MQDQEEIVKEKKADICFVILVAFKIQTWWFKDGVVSHIFYLHESLGFDVFGYIQTRLGIWGEHF